VIHRCTVASLLLLLICTISGQGATEPQTGADDDHENWQIEFTGGYWPLSASGQIQTRFIAVDVEQDLGISGRKSHPVPSLTFQPARKHKITIEGVPYRLNGGNALQRTFQFQGRTFAVQDQIDTKVKLNYVYAGYEYDVISRPHGFAGILAGVAYLQSSARVRSLTLNQEETVRARVPFPTAGGAARLFPVNGQRFDIHGEIKGMHFGDYGHYLQSKFGAGFSFTENFTLQAGYAILDADVHNKDESQGVNVNFSGPFFSVQWRNR
jgi:hypothetical protein